MVLPLLGAFFASAAAPAAIGAAASLVGGALGRNAEKKAIASQNEYNSPVNVRARAEEAGFNPLLFVGPGVGQQTATGGSNYMGSAIADAGMLVADAVSRRRELGRLEQLQSQNQKLAEKVTNLTLRPKVGGIYARREEMPSIAAALGRTGNVAARSAQGKPDDKRRLSSGDRLDAVGGIGVPDPVLDRGTGWFLFGNNIKPVPGLSPSSVIEEEYGDVGSALYGLLKFPPDVGYTLGEAYEADKAQRRGAGPVMSVGGQKFMLERSPPLPKADRPRRNPNYTRPALGYYRPPMGFGF